MWKIKYSKQALKDAQKIATISGLKANVKKLLDLIEENPYQYPPPYEKLVGDLQGSLSRRINKQHRLVYEVFKKEKTVKIESMWTHYE